jgi:hypothetical protein
MVCRSGFTKTAKGYASNLGIELCNLHDARSRNWNLDIALPILWHELLPSLDFRVEARFQPDDFIFFDERGDYYISADQGKTRILVLPAFEAKWNRGELPREPGGPYSWQVTGEHQIYVKDKDGELAWRPVRSWRLTYTVWRRSWLGYFKPEECKGIVTYGAADTFVATYLPMGEIPKVRDGAWTEIPDPDKLAVSLRGTYVTSEGWQVEEGTGVASDHIAGWLTE